MKKFFTLLLVVTTLKFSVKAQNLLIENFDFTATDIVGQNGWSTHSGTADPVATTTGLTFTGYAGSGIGNAANVIGAGYDYNRPLSDSATTNGSVIYTSMLLNFTQAAATATTGSYFFHLGNRASATSFTAFCARLFAKTDASGNVSIGISNSSTTPVYSPTTYALNTTYLVIIKYTINTAGNDEALLWIKPSGVPATEVAAGAPDVSLSTEAGQDIVDAIGIRQAANIPDVIIDGIRVGKTWNESVLPLSLKSFSASLINQNASLVWNTTNEINVDGFSIEKSNDGRTFNNIGFVAAKNAASANYAFNDVLVAGVNYYRLKITDKDGSFKYSSVVAVNAKQSTKLDIFPNPVVNTATLSHTKAGDNATIKLITIDGKTVLTQNIQAGATQSSIDVSKLIKGNYLVVFENEGNRTSLQFVKQ